jgi:two-component system sensor histidine kinase VicK
MLMPSNQEPDHLYIFADSDMAGRTRAYPWENTSLGAISSWPAPLLSLVNQILDSSFPMFIWWGSDKIQFYNDAYLHILGTDPGSKHPKALGQRGEECWPEIWEVISPLLQGVLTTAKPVYLEDQLIPIYRKGILDEVYWTFSYNVARDVDGSSAGILVVCTETTSKVKYQQEIAHGLQAQQALNEELRLTEIALQQANFQLEQRVKDRTSELAAVNSQLIQTQETLQHTVSRLKESNNRFQDLIRDAKVGIVVLVGKELQVSFVNPTYSALIGSTADQLLGKSLYELLPGQKDTLEQIFLQVQESGEACNQYDVPYQVSRGSGQFSGYMNVIYQPYREADGQFRGLIILCQDTTEEVNARLLVKKADEMTNLAIKAARLGSWHLDPENKSLIYNDTLAELFGYEGTEKMTFELVLGQVSEEYRVMVIEEINKAIAHGGYYDVTFTQTRFDNGELIWLRSLGKIAYDKSSNPSLFSGFVMDVTEQKKDEQRKNDFIGMVSHELKTPITSLLAYLQLLQNKSSKKDDQFAVAALGNCLRQVKKMTSMINGFLNVSRLDSGKIQIDKQRFDMALLMKEIEEESMASVSSHAVLFAPVEETWISADKNKIGQVIENLISNAVKYSSPNSGIKISCVHKDQQVQVAVSDEGPGIPANDLDQIFERYYRTEAASESLIAGFGIGLYLCSEIIEHHNGKIWVESEEGVGATFYFTLPL